MQTGTIYKPIFRFFLIGGSSDAVSGCKELKLGWGLIQALLEPAPLPALQPDGTTVPVKVTMPVFCNDEMSVYDSTASDADPAPLSHSFTFTLFRLHPLSPSRPFVPKTLLSLRP